MNKQQVEMLINEVDDIYIEIVGVGFAVEFYINDVRIEYFDEYIEITYCNQCMKVKLDYIEIIEEK